MFTRPKLMSRANALPVKMERRNLENEPCVVFTKGKEQEN